VIILTAILLIISTIEILFVSMEIHEHYTRSNFDKILTIKLDDFITEKKEKNVKKIVTDFIEQHPEYNSHRNEIYHTICQIMETHREEVWEKVLNDKLQNFVKRRKKMNVDDILKAFIKKYPQYKKSPGKIYQMICDIMGTSKEERKKFED
jgi:dGTP triphosphohydrolase